MQAVAADPSRALSPEDLLGPLNDVERRNAPHEIFVAGDVDLLRRSRRISIVGSRRASAAGLKRACRLARGVVDRGAIVVSGLALGIDTAAHETAIDRGGRTIAVLATPLDDVTPPSNRLLQRRIMEEHLALTLFPSGHPISRGNFPRRNRLMALVSDATVIVEAADGSGSLSQGWEALRLGRPLFLLRSLVGRADLDWPAEMLRYGADVLEDVEELFDAVPAGRWDLAGLTF